MEFKRSISDEALAALKKVPQSLGTHPNSAYKRIIRSQPVEPIESVIKIVQQPEHEPVAEGYLRFVVISDTHGFKPRSAIPDGDVLLHCGDFTRYGSRSEVNAFVQDYLKALPHRHKVVIAGNHDLCLEEGYLKRCWDLWRDYPCYKNNPEERMTTEEATATLKQHCHYLMDETVVIEGIRIFGSPWQPFYRSYAFNLERGKECAAAWARIPRGTDILMTHGPPLGRFDLCKNGNRAGCLDLLKTVQGRVRPAVHCFGHIHEDSGMDSDGVTAFINATVCDLGFEPNNRAVVFDLPIPTNASCYSTESDTENDTASDTASLDTSTDGDIPASACALT